MDVSGSGFCVGVGDGSGLFVGAGFEVVGGGLFDVVG